MRYVVTFWGMLFCLGLAMGATSPYIGPWALKYLDASSVLIGVLFACSAVGTMIGGPVIGSITDRTGNRKSAIVVSLLIDGASTIWLSHCTTVAGAVLGMVGMSAGGISIPLLLVGASEAGRRQRDTGEDQASSGAMAFVRMGFSLGFAVGAPLGGVLAGVVGYQGLLMAFGAELLVLAGAALLLLPDTAEHAHRRSRALPVQTSLAPLLIFCLAGVLVMLSDQAKVQFLPLQLTHVAHLQPSTVGLLFGVQAALEFLTMPLAGRLADRFGLAIMLMVTFALPVPYLIGISTATNVPVLLCLQVLQAGAVAGFSNLAFLQAQRLAPGREGFATSLYGSGFSASQLASGLLVGGMSQQLGIGGALRFSAVPVAVGWLLLLLVLRRPNSQDVRERRPEVFSA